MYLQRELTRSTSRLTNLLTVPWHLSFVIVYSTTPTPEASDPLCVCVYVQYTKSKDDWHVLLINYLFW